MESDSTDKGQVINGEVIDNMPLNGRNYSDLACSRRACSARCSRSAGDPREGSFNVNGLPSSQNNFILDGVDNNSYGTSNQGFSNQVVQVSPDAVQEFKVQTNNYSAEYGRAGGAVINASHAQRHQSAARLALRVSAQHRPQRHRLLQAGRQREAGAAAEPVRR